jgi:methyl-accepting chemotaxis protein
MKLMVKHKIIGLASLAALLPVIVLLVITVIQKDRAGGQVSDELDILARENVQRIALDVYGMLETANDLLQTKVNSNLNVIDYMARDAGGFRLSDQTVSWEAVNQSTNDRANISLPRMVLGNQWLGQNTNPKTKTPFVDETVNLIGGIVTVFQRMNDRGDMLRVASNVIEDGKRAIGTFVPAVDSNGASSPVVSAVLAGKTYRGLAFVVDAWYLTAYQPVKDPDGRVIGMIAGAVKQEEVQSLRQSIMDVVVGKTGYVFILGGKGSQQGKYLLSYKGLRDGENIWGAKDSDGRLFIQSIVQKALALGKGDIDFERYPWLNEGDAKPRTKVTAIAYFEPWDWVIGAGTYEDDFYEARRRVDTALNQLLIGAGIGGGIILLIAIALALLIGTRIANPIIRIRDIARKISLGDLSTEVDVTGSDEVGQLADAFREMSDSLKIKADAAEQIAKGNLNVELQASSDVDVLGNAMIAMRESIHMLLAETQGLIEAVRDGRLDKRGNASQFQGGWRNLVEGINELIEAFMAPMNMTAEYIQRISKGDVPDKITEEYRGDFNEIKNSLNTCIDAIDRLVADTKGLVETALDGKLSVRADDTQHDGDFALIIKGINQTLDAVIEPVREASESLAKMADGNLTRMMEGEYKGDHAIIKESLNTTLSSLNDILGQVSMAVDQVAEGSTQVSEASQSLSQGATEQASSLEEISSSMTQIGSQTRLNAENATQTNTLALSAREAAETGNGRMQQMISAMDDINASSSEVSKIIKVIDEIAFQTNLLALNAAVEAARAGVHGKGFAVVAEEVRNLAQRSAKAAKETTELIEGSIQKVERGNGIASETAKALEEIVNGITKVTDLVNEIASASKEQATGIDQITEALGQIDQVTQSNTASAEESAAAAEELSGQSDQLRMMLNKFELMKQELKREIPKSVVSNHDDRRVGIVESKKKEKKPSNSEEVLPDEVISLEDSDFSDF